MSEARPLRAYVDTSVFGGVFDDEFAEHSRAFFLRVERLEVEILLGETTERELSLAPVPVRDLVSLIPSSMCVRCAVDQHAVDLANAYLQRGVVGPRWRDDALHVATATIHRADVLVSWNFKHIVRFDRIRAFNVINTEKGHPPIFICSPAEVRYGGEEQVV